MKTEDLKLLLRTAMKNNPLQRFMYSIDEMTIAKKTSLLFLIMVSGMLFIGSFAHMSLNRMSDNFNILYTKRMLPVIRLEKLKDIYTVNILDTLRDIENGLITFKQGKDVILLAEDLTRREWSEYKSSVDIDERDWLVKLLKSWGVNISDTRQNIKFDDEKALIHKIERKIGYIESILSKMFVFLEKNEKYRAYNVLQDELYPSVYSMNIDLTQLINLNLEASKEGKNKTDMIYKSTFEWIVLGTLGTITFAGLLALIILKNIRRLHEQLAKMIDEKTKELQELNRNLEIKIKKEVEESRKKDEIMFRQSRYAAMGEMIGNIAHQWRQPLNALLLIIQSFQTKKMLGAELSDEFIDSQVKEGLVLANSMSKTIDDFRNFFNPNKKEEFFSIEKAVSNSIEIIEKYYQKEEVSIVLICHDDVHVLGYENEFSQVLINLFSNSKDALSESSITPKLIEVIVTKTDDREVLVEVVDNGGGIAPEVIERMFEPYFTTKHKSSGTGIGLYMSQQIIEKQMEGKIVASNKKHRFVAGEVFDKCASMKIYLPIRGGEKR